MDTTLYQLVAPLPTVDVAVNRLSIDLPYGTSPFWLARLFLALDLREPRLRKLRDYHRGQQDTWPLHSDAARDAFGRMFDGLKSNLAEPIVEAPASRLRVEGFRVGGDAAGHDAEAWRIWLANRMDSRSAIAHTEAIAMGECPVIVDRDPEDPATPRITVEDPLQVYVERDPRAPDRRLAAVKRWVEPDGTYVAILYLPDRVEWWRGRTVSRTAAGYKAITEESFDLRGRRWTLDRERSGLPPVPGVVPVIPLLNKPRVDGTGQAEHESVMPLLDLLNKTILDLAVTSEFAAYPLRYLIGVSMNDEQRALDDGTDGDDPAAVADPSKPKRSPLELAVNRWLTTSDPDAQIGQLPPAALEPYSKAIATIVEHIGTVTSTPYHLLLNAPSSVPATGEALKTTERALDAKVEGKQADIGGGWAEVMQLAFRTAGDLERAKGRPLTRWRAPAAASEAQHVDALSKLKAIGVDLETILEMVPLPPDVIARVMARQSEVQQVTADQANTAGVLVRSGWTPEGAEAAAGMPHIEHTGLLPVTVQQPKDATPADPPIPNA